MDALATLMMPQSVEAEQSTLGAILIDSDALIRVAEFLRPEDFYKDTHRAVYEAALSLFDRSEPVDLITVTEELRRRRVLEKVGDVDYLQSLMELVPTAANAEYYGHMVQEKAQQRKLIQAGHQIAALGFASEDRVESMIDKAEQIIFSIGERRTRGFYLLEEILAATFEHIEELYNKKAHVTGVGTGFDDLDYLTAGFQKSDLIVVAARPSMGKTSLCMNIAVHAAVKEKVPVAIFSLETAKEQLVLRMLCSEACIDAQRLRTGNLRTEDWQKLARAIDTLSKAKIYIDDTPGMTVLEIRSKARKLLQEQKGIGMIIVDHLQLVGGSPRWDRSENKAQEVAEISRGLKFLAKELNIPVVVVSQLNRAVETRNDKRPFLSDLRESGAIEQDADIIMFVYRDEYYNQNSEEKGIAEILVAKHRNGPVGVVKLIFMKEYTRFASIERR